MRYSEIFPPRRRVLAAVLFALGSSGAGVESHCLAGGHTHGPIYRTLDALAGGIEKVIDVVATAKMGSMGRSPVCDDGCDETMMAESMMPPALPPSDDLIEPSLPAPPPMMEPSHQPLRAPMMPTVPKSTPRVLPAPPSNQRSAPVPLPTPKTADDEWLDSFSDEPVQQSMPRVPQRQMSSPPRQNAGPGDMRRPSETYDSLQNPFQDDPQSHRPKSPAAQPASYWEPW